MRHFPNLTWLRLDATAISGDGLRYVGALKDLEQLYLDQTKISDADVAHLTALTKLRVLNLHDTDVTPEGVAGLKRALPNLVDGTGYTPRAPMGIPKVTGTSSSR